MELVNEEECPGHGTQHGHSRYNEFVEKMLIKEAVRAENKKIQEGVIKKYLSDCFERMYGEINPYNRNSYRKNIWH
jgi:hypothetical protein